MKSKDQREIREKGKQDSLDISWGETECKTSVQQERSVAWVGKRQRKTTWWPPRRLRNV